ncbi:hypothetical protein FJZ36_18315, partial [Candidatus Poribacteria bacterium]|nr:hypothetical protein [Candidatus Poribacteria bacterium]
EGQAAILTEVLGDAALHAARASDALESTTTRRLEDLLILLDKWDREVPLTDQRLFALVPMQGFIRLHVLDDEGNLVAANRPGWGMRRRMGPSMREGMPMGPPGMRPLPEPAPDFRPPQGPGPRRPPFVDALMPYIQRLKSSGQESLVMSLPGRSGQVDPRGVYGVVHRRTRGGVLAATVETEALTALREAASRDTLFDQVARADGILSVGWSPLSGDVVPSGFRWEWQEMDGKRAFVGIRTIDDIDSKPIEIRVALDAKPILDTEREAWQQGGVRLALVALATLAVTGLLFSRQNVQLLRDETDRIQAEVHRLEEESRRRDKLTAMGELAAGVAHEIRNPLNAIAMVSQRLAREFEPHDGDAEYQELLSILRDESARVESVVDQFLRFARPPKIEPRQGDLAAMLRDAGRRLRPVAESSSVALEVDANEPTILDFDPEQLYQAIANVVRNAVEAGGGVVRIALASDADSATVTVTDQGCGIPPDQLERVFDLYYTTKTTGTGLGLALVHQVVADHGGAVAIESREGAGTTVTITLPRGRRVDDPRH